MVRLPNAVGAHPICCTNRWFRWHFAAIFLLCVPVLACSGDNSEKTVAETALPVVVHRVGDTVSARSRMATGTVRLRRETPLAFVSAGRVQNIHVREGDIVSAGQNLAELDRSAIDAAAQSSEARARQADSEARRQRELFQKGWVSKARVETADAAAEAARADKSAAQFNRRFATISAPSSGIVLQRLAEPGQTLAAGTPVIILGEFGSGFVVRVRVPARQAAVLRLGQDAQVSFRDGTAPASSARIIEIAGRADSRTGTFQVELALPSNAALRSGLIADVAFPDFAGDAHILIPATALFSARADEGFVWLYDRQTRSARPKMVKLGDVSDGGIEVLAGLARGDLIVASGVDRLLEGQKLKLVAERPPATQRSVTAPVAPAPVGQR